MMKIYVEADISSLLTKPVVFTDVTIKKYLYDQWVYISF